MGSVIDPRRIDKINRYKAPQIQGQSAGGDDYMPDYMNILGKLNIGCYLYDILIKSLYISGMVFSMCALMMKLKWCAWLALYCSCISFANSRASDDAKQVIFSLNYGYLIVKQYVNNISLIVYDICTNI